MIYRDYSKDIEALRKFGVLMLMVLGGIWTAVVWITKKTVVPILKWLWGIVEKYPVQIIILLLVILPIVSITILFWEIAKKVLGMGLAFFLIIWLFSGITLKDIGWGWILSGGGGGGSKNN